MIEDPIPKTLGQWVTFEDTLEADDDTEHLLLTSPDSVTTDVAHAQLARTENPNGTVTYRYSRALDQAGRWQGEFAAEAAAANRVRVRVYVVP